MLCPHSFLLLLISGRSYRSKPKKIAGIPTRQIRDLLEGKNPEAARPGGGSFDFTVLQRTFFAFDLEAHGRCDNHCSGTSQFDSDLAGGVAVYEEFNAGVKDSCFKTVKLFFLNVRSRSIIFMVGCQAMIGLPTTSSLTSCRYSGLNSRTDMMTVSLPSSFAIVSAMVLVLP